MNFPITVAFQGMQPSSALRADIEQHAQRLAHFHSGILSCQTRVRFSEHRHHKGNRFLVRVHVAVPGAVLDAGQTALANHSHEDAHVAVRDAFDAMRRRLEDQARVRRGDVKRHREAELDT